MPINEIDISKFLPVFATGLREKAEPQRFLAHQGFKELINMMTVDQVVGALRSIIYPLKDALKTLDDEIVVKTLHMILAMCKKYDVVENKKGKRVIRNKDKIAEAFVEYFHLLLPNIQVV